MYKVCARRLIWGWQTLERNHLAQIIEGNPLTYIDLDTDPLCSTWKKLKLTSKFSEPNATEYRPTPCPA